MTHLFKLILGVLASLFRSRTNLEAEILVLRQQINVLRRRASKRPHLNNTDRFLFVWLYRWFPSVLGAITIVRPETIVRWHRAGFRAYNETRTHLEASSAVRGAGSRGGAARTFLLQLQNALRPRYVRKPRCGN
jgi:hypothetical protein